jgi:hypothetical protein
MYLKNNFIPLNAVLSDVYQMIESNDGAVTEDNLLEWAAVAMEHVTTFKMWEHSLCIVPVTNYKAQMPAGVQELDFIMYKKDCDVNGYMQKVLFESERTDLTPTSPNFPYVMVKERFYGFLGCQSCSAGWKFLSMSYTALDQIGARFQACEDSPSLHCICEDSFSINYGCKMLTTTFSDGMLLIAYKSHPIDSDSGNFLIPDMPAIRQAIETYVYMKIWQKRSFGTDQGARTMYQDYLRQWELLCAKAVMTQLLPDEMGYVKMTKLNKLIHHESPWAALTNMGREKFNRQ